LFAAGNPVRDKFTEVDSWDELRSKVRDAVENFYFDSASPWAFRLHVVRDELLTLAGRYRET